jgi:hypothetical protein
MPPPYFKITTQAYFSVKNKVSDGTEHRDRKSKIAERERAEVVSARDALFTISQYPILDLRFSKLELSLQ